MKNTILTAAVLALGVATSAQNVPAQSAPATTVTESTTVTTTAVTEKPKWSGHNATVDSISAKYKLLPMPGELTLEKKFPAIGSYQLAGTTEGMGVVTITPDSISKGVIWVSGLPQGSFKAYLAKSPATYRIISQKSAEGKAVPEGTLVYSAENNTLQIALGAPYNTANPVAIFPALPVVDATAAVTTEPAVTEVKVKKENKKTNAKSKSKVTIYTASKLNTMSNASSNAAFGQQLQQSAQQQ